MAETAVQLAIQIVVSAPSRAFVIGTQLISGSLDITDIAAIKKLYGNPYSFLCVAFISGFCF